MAKWALYLLVPLIAIASGAATTEPIIWESVEDKDGIQTFRREVPGSPIVAFKGIGTISAPIAKVTSVLIDEKRTKEWVDAVDETRILRMLAKNEAVVYTRVKTPIVMKDRDFVSKVKLEINGVSKTVTLSYEPGEDPEAPTNCCVRGIMMDSSFILVSKNNDTETLVTAEIHADPKGLVPKWVVNLFQKVWPRRTLENMRKQVAKPDIADHEDVKAAMAVQK